MTPLDEAFAVLLPADTLDGKITEWSRARLVLDNFQAHKIEPTLALRALCYIVINVRFLDLQQTWSYYGVAMKLIGEMLGLAPETKLTKEGVLRINKWLERGLNLEEIKMLRRGSVERLPLNDNEVGDFHRIFTLMSGQGEPYPPEWQMALWMLRALVTGPYEAYKVKLGNELLFHLIDWILFGVFFPEEKNAEEADCWQLAGIAMLYVLELPAGATFDRQSLLLTHEFYRKRGMNFNEIQAYWRFLEAQVSPV